MRPDRRVLYTEYLNMLEEGLLDRERCQRRGGSLMGVYEWSIRLLVEDRYPEDTEVAAAIGYKSGTRCCADEAESHAAFVIASIAKLGLTLDDQHAHTRQVVERLEELEATGRMSIGYAVRARGLLQRARKAESALRRRIDNRKSFNYRNVLPGEESVVHWVTSGNTRRDI